MPICIIYTFKIIHVHHEENRILEIPVLLQFLIMLDEGLAIVQAGQLVDHLYVVVGRIAVVGRGDLIPDRLAQREGRAKDASAQTQEAVLKMLAMGGDLSELNIVPMTISYEFDPCDYLKAQEFQEKRDIPHFKKTRQEDLDNMKTGIFGYKGRVHYRCGTPVNVWIDELRDMPKTEFYAALARRIDKELHQGYAIYPCNYIALDDLEGTRNGAAHYTAADRQHFEQYLDGQLAKVTLPNEDIPFLRECILNMYANPLRNYLKATNTQL